MDESEPERILTEDSGRSQYRRRKGEKKTTLHWGQRKLLMSEIEFLTMYGGGEGVQGRVVVYAGSAPGGHIPYLSKLFPQLSFVLIDPNPFEIQETSNIRIIKDYFSSKLAKELHDETVSKNKGSILFISDIRTADWKSQSAAEYQKYLKADNTAQAEWHNLISPVKSMLKFSLPYEGASSTFLDGDVYLPVWGPQTTTECRLIPTTGDREWDHKEHEEKMFYFNTVTRVRGYDAFKSIKGVGYDHRYDCSREIQILRDYCLAYGRPLDDISEMSAEISGKLNTKYTLATHPLNPFLMPRTSSNLDGQQPRKAPRVATRAHPHPCSSALTTEGGGTTTDAHKVLSSGASVVMSDSLDSVAKKEKKEDGGKDE